MPQFDAGLPKQQQGNRSFIEVFIRKRTDGVTQT